MMRYELLASDYRNRLPNIAVNEQSSPLLYGKFTSVEGKWFKAIHLRTNVLYFVSSSVFLSFIQLCNILPFCSIRVHTGICVFKSSL